MYLHYHSCFQNFGNFWNSFLGNDTILLASFFQTIVWHHCISNYHIIRIKCCLNCDRFTHINHFFSSITLQNQILFCNYVCPFMSITSLWLLQCFFHSSLTLFAFQHCNHSHLSDRTIVDCFVFFGGQSCILVAMAITLTSFTDTCILGDSAL